MAQRPQAVIHPPAGTPAPGSVTNLLDPVRRGDGEAIRKLWDRFFGRLVALAGSRLGPNLRQPVDAEDVALHALDHFCRVMARPDAAEHFPEMANRENVWRVLARITVWEALDYVRPPGGPVFGGPDGLERVPARAAELPERPGFGEEVQRLLDQLRGRDPAQTNQLRKLALMKLDGKSNKGCALALGCSVALVELLLRAIRTIWEEHDPRPQSARRCAAKADS